MKNRQVLKGNARPKESAVGQNSEKKRMTVVGIGASAGGLEGFKELLEHLPEDTGMAFVLVQHLDPDHESSLTEILARATKMPVREVTDKVELQADHVYVIPPDKRLTVKRGQLRLKPREQTAGPQHSIDAFLESLAQEQQEQAIGVILSGTASDGTQGLEAIKAEGGTTFAQDGSAKNDSMPRNAVAAGCVDYVLAPEGIAQELARIAKHPHVAGGRPRPAGEPAGDGERAELARSKGGTAGETGRWIEDNSLRKILLLVRNQRGVDFSLYKPNTMQRRIARRMVLGKCETLGDYANFLRGNDKELEALYSDLLISVTSFFRNPEAFAALKRGVFPKLFERRGLDGAVRVWVAGCSTGQEVYSIGMVYQEFCDQRPRAPELQIFGTDLNEALLERARQGLYPASLAEQVSPERLRRFFVEEEGGYRINKSLRERCVFARHNLLSDPPFSRLDLISCRNLLIYIEAGLQRKILPTFHYALKPNGFLLLGASESVGPPGELFEAVDKKLRVFRRKPGVTPKMGLPAAGHRGADTKQGARAGKTPEGKSVEGNALREADRITANRFGPPGVVIDSNLRIVQSRGAIEPYLRLEAGTPSLEVLKMARGDLMLPLRAAINKARKEGKTVRREKVGMSHNAEGRKVTLEVIPLKNLREQHYLIFFRQDTRRGASGGGSEEPEASESPTRHQARRSEAPRLARVERELNETREYLQSVQEHYEAANEELQASNEEVTSANEELQSMNEELETSKEELESSNEELTTLNEEMVNRNRELSQLNSDLNNLQVSIDTPILVLGRDLKIRRFTPLAERVFNLMASDTGRRLSGIRHNLVFPRLEEFITETIRTLNPGEREVQDNAGNWYVLRVRPCLTVDRKIDGAVVVLVDVNVLKETEEKIRQALDFAEAVIESVPPLVILEPDLRVRKANEAFYASFGVAAGQTQGRLIYELGNGQWNLPALRKLLGEVLAQSKVFKNYEVTHDFETIGRRTMLMSGREVESMHAIVLSIEDITEREQKEETLRKSEERFRALVTASSEVLYTMSPDWSELRQLEGGEFIASIAKPSRTWLEQYIPAEDQPLVTAVINEAIRGKNIFELEHRVRRADGTVGWTFSRAIPLLDARGEIAEWFGAAVDTTERRRAEAAVARLAAIVEWSEDAIFSENREGIIQTWNAGAERIFGYRAEEVIGRPVTLLIPPEGRDEAEQILAQLKRGEPITHYETVRLTKDGRRLDVSLTISPIKDSKGRNIGTSRIVRDIGDLLRARNVLARSKADLERLVAERTAKLQELVGELEHFSYTITHDMRAPLRSMQGYAEMLDESWGSCQEQDAKGLLKRIRTSASRMDSLITDALNYNQTVRQELALAPVDAGALLRGMLDTYPELQPARARIEILGELPRVMGNEAGLTQCFSNLLGNAVKFVKPGETPEIRIWAEEVQGPTASDQSKQTATREQAPPSASDNFQGLIPSRFVRIWVEDKGIGIPKEAQERVFDMFHRENKNYEGTGIGLALVRKVAQRMAGKVGVDSQEGKGSRFWLELRAAGLFLL